MKITFIIGGSRSGKSSFALKEASRISGPKAYIATAEALDEEMRDRIDKHKIERSSEWDTFEEPVKIAEVIIDLKDKYQAVILDCLTIWLANVLQIKMDIEIEINKFVNKLADIKDSEKRGNGETGKSSNHRFPDYPCHFFIVSNEVGMGVVPENKLGRQFRDLAGMLNQKVAEIADEVYLVSAGIPMKIKSA